MQLVTDGQIAFANDVNQIIDLLEGRVGGAVLFDRNTSPTLPSLKVRNRDVLGAAVEGYSADGLTRTFRLGNTGMESPKLTDYLDMKVQAAAPAAPGAGAGVVRLYARSTYLGVRIDNGVEQSLSISAAPTTTYFRQILFGS